MKDLTFLFIITLFLSVRLFAQEAPKVKFEKVPEEDLSMKSYPSDSTAEAVILYDEGSSDVRYDTEKGFMLTFERFVRIKILKKSGVEWGNFYIPLYSSDKYKEEMALLKGTTINLEGGKVIKDELKKSAIFKKRENKYWEAVKLSMPSVKVGSVIDLHYRIYSDLTWNLRTWKFQYSIPVKWSQYSVNYPEYYNYNQSFMGYYGLLYRKESQKSEEIDYSTVETNTSSAVGNFRTSEQHSVRNQISYLAHIFDYAAKDIPAIKTEPYLTSIDNYSSQLKFELASENFFKIGGKFKNFTTTWTNIAEQLRTEDYFGQQLIGTGFINDMVAELTKGTSDTLTKIGNIYNYVQHVMKWDGSRSIFANKSIKKAYADKTGNPAEINLLLVAMLNKAGIIANPVVLSTRENGILSITHPTITDCNYVIVQTKVDGHNYLLDATEPDLQAGFIPFRCLNGEGHSIGKESSEPVKLSDPRSAESTMVELELKGGKLSGGIKKRDTGLSAFDFRRSVKSIGGKKEYFDKLKNSATEIDYSGYNYSNLDSLSEPVLSEYTFALKEKADSTTGMLYISPVIDRIRDNPFTSPTRSYPVDFGVPLTHFYNLQLTVPEGYLVEELPQSKFMVLEGQGGQFQYQISQFGNKIMLTLKLSINKTVFLPAEYLALRNFYDLVINKQAEQIVLKKKPI